MKKMSDFRIIKIEQIQNKRIWINYQAQIKQQQFKNNAVLKEKFLFHGSSFTKPELIMASDQGFDNNFSN